MPETDLRAPPKPTRSRRDTGEYTVRAGRGVKAPYGAGRSRMEMSSPQLRRERVSPREHGRPSRVAQGGGSTGAPENPDNSGSAPATGTTEARGRRGAPGGTRTPDPRLRRPLLYPTELQARASYRSTTLSAFRTGARQPSGWEGWSGRADLNGRPPAPKAGALPGCATPRRLILHYLSPRLAAHPIGVSGPSRRALSPLENAEERAPGPHGLRVLARERLDDLAEMVQVVDRPRGEQVSKGDRSEVGMLALASEVSGREP